MYIQPVDTVTTYVIMMMIARAFVTYKFVEFVKNSLGYFGAMFTSTMAFFDKKTPKQHEQNEKLILQIFMWM